MVEVLVYLAEHPGEVISKEQLIQEVWGGAFVTDAVLTRCVSELRKTMGDDPRAPQVIDTIPRKGYRLLQKVERVDHVSRVASPPRKWKWWAVSSACLIVLATVVLRRPKPTDQSRMLPGVDIKQIQLTANSSENPVSSAAISPDGKYLAYADLTGIHIRLIETGDVNNIPQPETLKDVPVDWAVGPWFNDGARFLAVANFPSPRGPNFSPTTWTVSLLGTVPHLLRENATAYSISPDGNTIAFTTTAERLHGSSSNLIDGDREIWLMDQDGEHPRQIHQGSGGDGFSHVQWSSDGQRVAYLRTRNAPDRDENSIESLDLKGNPPTTVMPATDPAELQEFRWLPDGRVIYLKNDNYWEATEVTGGKSRRLTNWAGFGMTNMSVTADGKRLAFLRWSVREIVYVADYDPTRTRITEPRQLSQAEAQEIPTGWTADSKAVLFTSNRNGRWEIFKQLLGSETPEVLTTGVWENEETTPLTPDGHWFLYLDSPSNRGTSTPAKLMRVPATGGPSQMILTARVDGVRCARNLCAIVEPGKDPKELVFTAVDPLIGRGRELARFKDRRFEIWYDWAISPDGTRIAFVAVGGKTIHVLSLNGQPEHQINPKKSGGLEGLSWDVDGKGLISSSSTQRTKVLLYIDLQGNTRVLWEQGGRVGARLRGLPSPDGHHLAISAITLNCNAWMMENF